MEDTAEFRCNYHYLHYVVFNKERTQKEKFEIIRSDIADFLKEIDAVEVKKNSALLREYLLTKIQANITLEILFM